MVILNRIPSFDIWLQINQIIECWHFLYVCISVQSVYKQSISARMNTVAKIVWYISLDRCISITIVTTFQVFFTWSEKVMICCALHTAQPLILFVRNLRIPEYFCRFYDCSLVVVVYPHCYIIICALASINEYFPLGLGFFLLIYVFSTKKQITSNARVMLITSKLLQSKLLLCKQTFATKYKSTKIKRNKT